MFVDNCPFHLYENLEIAVPIVPYLGEDNDRDLLKLLLFLKGIYFLKDYRPILKQQFMMENYKSQKVFRKFMAYLLKN